MIAPDVIKKAKATGRIADWVAEEMADADLNDQRLNRRLKRILSDLAQHPTVSIPAACNGYAETAAAYRFFDNDKADFDGVLRPHIDLHPHPGRRPTDRPDGPGHHRDRSDPPRAAGQGHRAARRRRPSRRAPAR